MNELLQDSGPDMPKKKTFSQLLTYRDVVARNLEDLREYGPNQLILKYKDLLEQANAAIDAYMDRIETMCQQAQKVSFK